MRTRRTWSMEPLVSCIGSTAVEDEIRSPQEVARRSLALFAVVGAALGAQRDEVLSWLRAEDLWEALTPHEVAYLEQTNPPQKAHINFSWHSERLTVLLWALGHIQELPDSATQCGTDIFKSVLPPFAVMSTQAFIAQATLIDEDTLRRQAQVYLDEHSKARDARIHERPMPPGIDVEIVQERHHAINWITGYASLPWDEVTTDT